MLNIASHFSGKSESFRAPITMNLLPRAGVLGEEESERESEGHVVSHENPMGLFPQRTGFLTSASGDSRSQLSSLDSTEYYKLGIIVKKIHHQGVFLNHD